MCWSPDGGRVVSISADKTFRVWDVKSRETIFGPIKIATGLTHVMPMSAYYLPDGKMIATLTGYWLKIWDGNTGKLLKTHQSQACFLYLAWTSNGKALTTWGELPAEAKFQIMKFNTATWTVLESLTRDVRKNYWVSLSPDERFFGTASVFSPTVQLWNMETNQPIGTPLHHENYVIYATFSADGKFLLTRCEDDHIYMWDVFAILKEACLPGPAPKMKGAPQIPPGFFDDALREANLRIRLSQSHGPHNHSTPTPRQRTLSPFSSFWHRSKSHGETEHHTRTLSHSLNWTRNLVSGMLRRRDGSDIELREIEVPCTAGKPRNYHARKKPTASSSGPPKTHATQKPSASSSQLPPPAATTSTLSAVTGTAEASGTPSRLHITCTRWRARFMGWICCMPIQNADHQ
ncbi:WD40 repeat-like protein [Suillus hirtellus]|nr:WD40 repeat-like protein [Suillus hirtellus]